MARPLDSRAAQAIVIVSCSLFIVPFQGVLNNKALEHVAGRRGVMLFTGNFVQLVESYDQKKAGPKARPSSAMKRGILHSAYSAEVNSG
jgi:hypothetical protein